MTPEEYLKAMAEAGVALDAVTARSLKQMVVDLVRMRGQVAQALLKVPAGEQGTWNASHLRNLQGALDDAVGRFGEQFSKNLSASNRAALGLGANTGSLSLKVGMEGQAEGAPLINLDHLALAANNMPTLVRGMEEAAKKDMMRVISRGVVLGQPSGQVAKKIMEYLDTPDRPGGKFGGLAYQASRILVTEHGAQYGLAHDVANRRAMALVPADDYISIWLHSGQGNVQAREPHQKLHNGYIRMNSDERFDVNGFSATRPHDPILPAGEVINCRCTSVLWRLSWGEYPGGWPVGSAMDKLGIVPPVRLLVPDRVSQPLASLDRRSLERAYRAVGLKHGFDSAEALAAEKVLALATTYRAVGLKHGFDSAEALAAEKALALATTKSVPLPAPVPAPSPVGQTGYGETGQQLRERLFGGSGTSQLDHRAAEKAYEEAGKRHGWQSPEAKAAQAALVQVHAATTNQKNVREQLTVLPPGSQGLPFALPKTTKWPSEQLSKATEGLDWASRMVHPAGLQRHDAVQIRLMDAGGRGSYIAPGSKGVTPDIRLHLVRDPGLVGAHEMGHAIEFAIANDPKAYKGNEVAHSEVVDFLNRRAERHGYSEVELKGLPGEEAYAGGFHSPYTGKVYRRKDPTDGGPYTGSYATEVISMGLQEMYADAAAFARRDPEFFDLVINVLRGHTPHRRTP